MSEKKHDAVAIIEKTQPPILMHPVVQAGLASNPDPATLRELLAVQREWEAGEARKAYTSALVRLKADLPAVIAKDTEVDFTSRKTGARTHYKHASLSAAMDAVTPHLTRHGFSLSWVPSTPDGKVRVTCKLTHAGGHSEECSITSDVDTSGNKSRAQGTASTITLLQRYTALSLLGIATADMTEPKGGGNKASSIDSAANLRAVAAIKMHGFSLSEVEGMVGRPPRQWDSSDLDKVRRWYKEQRETAGSKKAAELQTEADEEEREHRQRTAPDAAAPPGGDGEGEGATTSASSPNTGFPSTTRVLEQGVAEDLLDSLHATAELDAAIEGEKRRSVLVYHSLRRGHVAAKEAAQDARDDREAP
jgi:hypothetical protein